MIDTHCHIHFDDFLSDQVEVIKRCRENLDCIINSGTSLEGNKTTLDLSKEYKNLIYPSLGYHPVTSQEKTEEDLKIAQNHIIDNLDDIVAIGEVGMDYF